MDTPESFPSGNAEILSQSDIERLLSQVAEQESSVEVIKGQGVRAKHGQDAIQPYDFRQPVFLSAGELRKLRLRQEDFTRSLAARLSMYLRIDFGLQMSRLQTITYQKFIENLQNPTYITLFKAEPLRGICMLDIPNRLGVTVVDRLLGGSASPTNLDRDMSDIEAALLDQAVQTILNEWCNQWSNLRELRPVILGHESSGRFLQTASHDTVMLCLSLESRLGECQETMQMAFPCYTLEPIMRQLSALLETNAKENQTDTGRVRWNTKLNDIPIQVKAVWDGLPFNTGQLARLKTGEILPLPATFSQQVQVHLGNLPKFVGRLGTQNAKWAVELTQVIKT